MIWQPVEYQSCPTGNLTYTDHAPTLNPSGFTGTNQRAMSTDVKEPLVRAQDLLEDGLQKCLGLTRGLMRNLERKVVGTVGYRLLSNAELREELTNVSGRLYQVMAETLFNLIAALQPEDCKDGQARNFYFWPGYHSVLINKRIFVEQEDKNPRHHEPERWNFGVGICGRPGEELSIYNDCCQARLFHYLIKPRNESHITPVDIHRLLLRRAAYHKDNLSHFLVVTNKPLPAGATPDSYFELPLNKHGSEDWGSRLDEFVWKNQMGKLLETRRKFRDDEVMSFRQYAQNKMQSLWLHSAFCDSEPPWLPSFIEELGLHDESVPLQTSLNKALADKTATNWGDRNERRPLFSSWVNLSLSPWLDPTDISFGVDEQPLTKKAKWASKTVGSAAFLSSTPVGPLYLAFAKHWVSEVYNAIRNAEMAILLSNKSLRVLEAFAAGPYFSHEIQTLVDQAIPTVQRELADDSVEAIKTRRFVLYSIRTLCTLAYSFTRAMMSSSEYVREREKNLLDPLRELRASNALLPVLTSIAKETYASLKSSDGAIVIFECSGAPEICANELQHGACFLLIVELLRNYCRSDRSGPTANFRTRLDGDILMIELEGSTHAERNPTSMSEARLNRFLRVLGVGQVTNNWNRELKSFKSTVCVNLNPDSATRHQFS